MSIILDNIKCLVDNEGIGITKLEEKIGASKGVLSRAIAKNSDIQAKWISKIVEIFPQYSCEWLIKNEGPMLKRTLDLQSESSNHNFSSHYKDLADSRKETIESLKKEIMYLEDKVAVYKKRED
ncbi:hypothetical protein EYY60_11305 [Flavobacterium zhairuonense]|uniref:hypothetical protein n=1 Tax=Flavobacterium zhairuonense TaxID=2493631 RepID=UPI001047F73D|nr:hypothetical protein [Flavobacterium zhairuonense]KAF2509930.1 hypothetical protein EYY60_11305 [Flavobacterium zhairuonense]